MSKLHIGCGDVIFPSWTNIDRESKVADVNIDVRQGLPFESDSVDFIFSEHFIEHLEPMDAVAFFQETKRVLRSGGVMRTAMPDLHHLCENYLGDWRNMPWIKDFGYEKIRTGAEMLNTCFYEWGHRWLYDQEELERRLLEAGLSENKRHQRGVSPYQELTDLEQRLDSRLIVETTKTAEW
jgi:predicted SAM-dependent methyltransferase